MRTLPGPSLPTRMFRVRPPQRPAALFRVIVDELEIVVVPWAGMTSVNGTSVRCWQVSTWVRPRSDERPMGIRKAPMRAISANRERRTDGIRRTYRTFGIRERTCRNRGDAARPHLGGAQLRPG